MKLMKTFLFLFTTLFSSLYATVPHRVTKEAAQATGPHRVTKEEAAQATGPHRVTKEEAAQATGHVSRMIREGKCDQPSPRVVKIQELFSNSRKRFLPSCTIIHVCGEDTGCCDHEDLQCAPLKQEVVTLYFWVLELTERGHKRTVESLTVKNDTECSCQSISNQTSKKLGDSLVELQSLVTSSHMSVFEGRIQEETISSLGDHDTSDSLMPATQPINFISLVCLIHFFLGINFLC